MVKTNFGFQLTYMAVYINSKHILFSALLLDLFHFCDLLRFIQNSNEEEYMIFNSFETRFSILMPFF